MTTAKKYFSSIIFLVILVAAGSIAAAPIPTSKIEVYYFYFTHRSRTSIDVEKVSRDAILTLYPVKVKRGEIFFKGVNLDEKEGAALGAKYKIKKQTLVIILGDKRVDLTKKGNKYATGYPEKLREEIKNAVDNLLK